MYRRLRGQERLADFLVIMNEQDIMNYNQCWLCCPCVLMFVATELRFDFLFY